MKPDEILDADEDRHEAPIDPAAKHTEPMPEPKSPRERRAEAEAIRRAFNQ